MNYKKVTYHELLTYANNYNIQVIPWKDCKLEKEMGSGASMNVFAGTYIMDEKQYNAAFKRLRMVLSEKTREASRSSKLKDVRQEVHIMGMFKGHPQIIQLLGVSFDDHNPVLILELATSDLENYLQVEEGKTGIDWDTKLRFAYEIIVAIGSIHEAEVIHGDLKAANILVCIEADNDNRAVAKVSDFGYSSTDLSGPGYTFQFRAPEDDPIDLKGKSCMDIYSYGLLVWQIGMNGETPFDGKTHDEIDDMKRDGTALKFLIEQLPEGTPEQIKKIIERTVIREPSERASVKDIMEILNSQEEAKKAFESWARDATQDTKGTVWVSKLETLSISPSLRKRIFTEYDSFAKEGDMIAMSRLGSCWRFGFGTEKNFEEAFRCFKKAAEGYPPAQTELGFCYSNGQGVKEDLTKAFELYMNAAKDGDSLAQFNVGVCYENGRGVAQDQKEAVQFYEKAASSGISQARYNLGVCYVEGKGISKDIAKAVELFTKAAEAGHPASQCRLGFCYTNGLGVSKDYPKGAALYKKAALSGNATAQCNLGKMYFQGIGVPRDLKKAREWFKAAEEQGETEAKNKLEYLDMLEMTESFTI